jgi:hypothetical protein
VAPLNRRARIVVADRAQKLRQGQKKQMYRFVSRAAIMHRRDADRCRRRWFLARTKPILPDAQKAMSLYPGYNGYFLLERSRPHHLSRDHPRSRLAVPK